MTGSGILVLFAFYFLLNCFTLCKGKNSFDLFYSKKRNRLLKIKLVYISLLKLMLVFQLQYVHTPQQHKQHMLFRIIFLKIVI